MADFIPVTAGSGRNVATLPATMPDTSSTDVPVGVIGLISGGNFVAVANANPFPVSIQNSTVAVTQSGSWTVTANAGTGTMAVSAASLPLPAGAATAANQTTANTTLSSILSALGSVAVTGTFWQTTQPVSAASLPLPTGAATAANQSTGNTTLASILSGLSSVTVVSAPTTPVTGTFWQTVQPVTQTPATSGGDSVYSVISSGAANQDATQIKGSAGQLYGYALFNTTSSARFVKFYNTASPTSASTPVLRIYLPPTGGANVSLPDGIPFGTAIWVRITTGAADADTGACSANDVLCNVWYK